MLPWACSAGRSRRCRISQPLLDHLDFSCRFGSSVNSAPEAVLRVTVPGRLSVGGARAGSAVSSGRLGNQVPMDFMELAVHRRLALQVLTVHPLDEVMRLLFARGGGGGGVTPPSPARRPRVVARPASSLGGDSCTSSPAGTRRWRSRR